MRMSLTMQLFTRALRALPGAAIADMTLADIERAQQRGFGLGVPGETLVTGGLVDGVAASERTIPAGPHDLRLRVYRRSGVTDAAPPLVVNFHGGGWVLGAVDSNDWTCSSVAARTGAVVVSVDYRLAPQHPYPAAREDCLAAVAWLAANAGEVGADGDRLAVMGDSAGGNLAAVTALRARELGGPAIAHQVLIYPGVDATLGSPSIHEKADAPVLRRADIVAFRDHYLGNADPADPLVSPLLADDLAGLPPALILTAEHDPLCDDGRRYAAALRDAGVPVRLTEYVGVPHGFLSFPGVCRTAAEQAMGEICQELSAHLW